MKETAKLGYDVIIVGAGPAGLCAAMYAGRGMLKALTIERGAPGGELLNTDLIEDYIGFESIKGWELAQKMAEHAKKFGAEIVTDTVDRIRREADGWVEVETARGNSYRSQAVILTAGNTAVAEIAGDEKGVTHAVLENKSTGKRSTLDVGGVCIFAGFHPNTQLVDGHVDHDAGGYLITDNKMMTSMAGLFAAGDVRSQVTRQITTAVGDATTAAIAVEKYLKSLRETDGKVMARK